MKMKKIMMLAAVAAGAMALNGCSILGFQNKTDQAATPTRTESQNNSTSATDANKSVESAMSNTSSQKKNKNKGQQSKQAGKEQAVHGNLAEMLAGEWAITAVGSRVIQVDEDIPYMNFVPAEGRFYGSNGCNVLNGNYIVKGDCITFGAVLSTMKFCPGVDFDSAISGVVKDGATVHAKVKKIGNETYLYINDSNGKALMTLIRHNMQFLDGNWQVVKIKNKDIDDEEANVFFDIVSKKIHGNTGCNFFNGNIFIDPAVPNAISFSGMGVTRMACPKGDQERTMLVALEETTTAVAGRNTDTAILKDAGGKVVMVLKRILAEDDDK